MDRLSAAVKYFSLLALCFLTRLVPHLPNVEPIMAAQTPAARRFGPLAGFGFGFFSILAYDAVTRFGVWTWECAIVYGIIGVVSNLVFRGRQASRFGYAAYAFGAVLFYDALTGPIFGALFNGQNFQAALAGQVPFTIYHLIGAVTFSFVVSPAIYAWLAPQTQEKSAPLGAQISEQPTVSSVTA